MKNLCPCVLAAVVAVAGCAAPAGQQSQVPSSTEVASPSARPSASNMQSSAPPTPSAAPPLTPTPVPMNEASGSQLTVPGFAEVTADRLTVRQEPGLSGEPLMDHIGCIDNPDPNCAQPILIGTATGYVDLYVVDGPVEVDGYEWYLATSHRLEMLGWVAGGDGVDAWLVSASRSCPSHPVELADVTVQATTSAELLHCFGQDELTVHGWYPDLPPGEQETNVGLEDCRAERGWLFCYSIFDMLRPEPGPWAGSADYLAFAVDPAAGVTMPGRSQWVEVTGSWEHPASATCGDIAAVLKCRGTFVVSAAHVP